MIKIDKNNVSEFKDVTISVRMSEAELVKLDVLRGACNCSRSEMVRALLRMATVKKVSKENK